MLRTGAGAAVLLALTMAAWAAPPAPDSSPPGVEIAEDGGLVHRPSGLRLLREVRGPEHSHSAMLHEIAPDRVVLSYGAITVTIGAPQMAADEVMTPPGFEADPSPPGLPALLLWGGSASPETVSFLSTDGGKDWLSFTVIAEGWQIGLSAAYEAEQRDTVVRTGEAVWAMIASSNEREPR